MRLIKLEKTIYNEVIRITYKTWTGKTKVRDVVDSYVGFRFVDSGDSVFHGYSEILDTFRRGNEKEYNINKT